MQHRQRRDPHLHPLLLRLPQDEPRALRRLQASPRYLRPLPALRRDILPLPAAAQQDVHHGQGENNLLIICAFMSDGSILENLDETGRQNNA